MDQYNEVYVESVYKIVRRNDDLHVRTATWTSRFERIRTRSVSDMDTHVRASRFARNINETDAHRFLSDECHGDMIVGDIPFDIIDAMFR